MIVFLDPVFLFPIQACGLGFQPVTCKLVISCACSLQPCYLLCLFPASLLSHVIVPCKSYLLCLFLASLLSSVLVPCKLFISCVCSLQAWYPLWLFPASLSSPVLIPCKLVTSCLFPSSLISPLLVPSKLFISCACSLQACYLLFLFLANLLSPVLVLCKFFLSPLLVSFKLLVSCAYPCNLVIFCACSLQAFNLLCSFPESFFFPVLFIC